MSQESAFCPRCGKEMEEAEVGGRTRHVCPGCGFILYRNPVPGVGVLVEMEGGIVLIQRGEEPFAGWWALPAGYIETDESVEQAAVRECREETGLEVELLELFGVGSFPEGPVQSGIIIFYRARPAGRCRTREAPAPLPICRWTARRNSRPSPAAILLLRPQRCSHDPLL